VKVVKRNISHNVPPTSEKQDFSGTDVVGIPGIPQSNGHNNRSGIIVIGASAGGPAALQTLFSSLDRNLPVPVVVVQHIEKGFASGFAEWLGSHSSIPVKIADDGETLVPGTAYLPPGDFHIILKTPETVGLSKGIPQHGLRPAVDVLFHSAARLYGSSSIGILLSGMGRDGANGLLAMKNAGAFTIVQDEASSLVYGMPGEAVRLGAACSICSPSRMSKLIHSYFCETNSTRP